MEATILQERPPPQAWDPDIYFNGVSLELQLGRINYVAERICHLWMCYQKGCFFSFAPQGGGEPSES